MWTRQNPVAPISGPLEKERFLWQAYIAEKIIEKGLAVIFGDRDLSKDCPPPRSRGRTIRAVGSSTAVSDSQHHLHSSNRLPFVRLVNIDVCHPVAT